MDERVERRLRVAGWFDGRRVDIAAQMACLDAEGYSPTPGLIALILEYSHLTFSDVLRGDITVDACIAVRRTWRSSVRYWSHRARVELYPIGICGADATLVADDNRFTYVGFGEELSVLGRFPDDVLLALEASTPLKPVPRLEGKSEADFVLDDDP